VTVPRFTSDTTTARSTTRCSFVDDFHLAREPHRGMAAHLVFGGFSLVFGGVRGLFAARDIVYSGGHPWTGIHEQWLRRQRFDDAHLRAGVRPLFPRRAFAFVDDEENARDGQQPRAPRSHATPTHV
jgi:hypothetical protein